MRKGGEKLQQKQRSIPIYITDKVIGEYRTRGYSCEVLAYNRRTFKTTTVDALIACPSQSSVVRVLKEELGEDWEVLDWNATFYPF